MIKLLLLLTAVVFALSAPPSFREKKNKTKYDFEQFDTVYDQRQNGTENYKINVNGVVLVYAPPQSLLQAAMMLDPALFEGEYPDVGELLGNNHEKPAEIFVIKPDKPSTTTTINPVTTTTTEKRKTTTTEASSEITLKEKHEKRSFKV
ncbi:unnamed protein product [Brassicogethes aeneus]|uniref:Uncharacterized protein n=1 Tax=Brassicogethes aeneus TaxID=1431903 RepID=A0A9P0FH32_BRAAE|nr:unnamed protein product [Brassicogethes aeneus]